MSLEIKIRKAQEAGKVIPGAKSVMNILASKEAEAVVLASNCPQNISESIRHSAKLAETPVEEFSGDSDALGSACKKPFTVAACAILK